MKNLISAFGDAIVGVTSGFDRIVFQGMLKPLMYPEGAMGFFDRRRILYKDAKEWFTDHTERLYCAVQQWSLRECGERIKFLPSSKTRKDELARQRQEEKEIKVGPVGSACGFGRTNRPTYVSGWLRRDRIVLKLADRGFQPATDGKAWIPSSNAKAQRRKVATERR